MLAAAAVLVFLIDGSLESAAVTPPGRQTGPAVYGGLAIAHAVSPRVTVALIGRAGGAHVDGWRPVFEGSAEVSWKEMIGLHAGARHDERLRRDGALADFRDPTGRLFVGVTAMPFRKGKISAGATFDYEHAMPGSGRLPPGTRITAVVRFRARG